MKTYETDPELFVLFEHIARRRIDIATLRTRGRDSLDFHDVSVWALLDIMQAAYGAGRKAGRSVEPSPPQPGSMTDTGNIAGTLHAADPESWLELIWNALHGYRETLIPEGQEPHWDEEWNDICTAMAWVREALGLPDEVAS